jgi:predicted AAA+ superfamily ATPase
MQYKRLLDLSQHLTRKSAFLFGARNTGKTSLYQAELKFDRTYNLLEVALLRQLKTNPGLISQQIQKKGELVVIDEIQKIPELLDEVQNCIQTHGTRFLLTGSSARKLKREHANLLGGRASKLELFPLVSAEIEDFDLLRYLNHGGLPSHYLASKASLDAELDDYVSLYLKEEISDEALTRNLDAFSRFIDIMALHSGDELAIENFASDCAIKATTFRNYLAILTDTLIGFEVTPFLATKKRKAITRSKFFLVDVGVTNYLAKRKNIEFGSEAFGRAFEHFIAQELRAFLSYKRIRDPLSYWRSTSQFEVDFIVGNQMAIEVKASKNIHDQHLKGLRALREEKKVAGFCVVSTEARTRTVDGITIFAYADFLKQLWSGKLIE